MGEIIRAGERWLEEGGGIIVGCSRISIFVSGPFVLK